jgi:hypothetical protein
VKKAYGRLEKVWWAENNCVEDQGHVTIGKQNYFLSGDGTIMPSDEDQPPPRLEVLQKDGEVAAAHAGSWQARSRGSRLRSSRYLIGASTRGGRRSLCSGARCSACPSRRWPRSAWGRLGDRGGGSGPCSRLLGKERGLSTTVRCDAILQHQLSINSSRVLTEAHEHRVNACSFSLTERKS